MRINPSTGAQGYAEREPGWISFSCASSQGPADYGIKTGWCQSTGAIPTGGPNLRGALGQRRGFREADVGRRRRGTTSEFFVDAFR